MTEVDLLFVVLAVLYLWECSCWVRRGSVVFRTWLGRRWYAVHPGTLLGNQQGGLVFASPLPPLGHVLTGNQFPLSISAEGILAFVAASVNPGGRPMQTARFVRFDDIKKIEPRARKVQIDDQPFFTAASPTLAAYLSEKLNQIQKAPAKKRLAAFEEIVAETLNCKAAEKRWQDFQSRTANLRWATNTLFLYLFVGAPVVIGNFGLRQTWLPLVLGLFALTLTTAILFHRTHKYFYPWAEDDRFTHFLIILLAPASTIRAHDVLSRPLLEHFHPLALAKLFCREELFRDFARLALTEIRYPALPACPNPDARAQETERQSRALVQAVTEKLLKQNGLSPDELLRPPVPADETCTAYCPRCLVQFTREAQTCEDCGGLPLVSFCQADTGKSTAPARSLGKA